MSGLLHLNQPGFQQPVAKELCEAGNCLVQSAPLM